MNLAQQLKAKATDAKIQILAQFKEQLRSVAKQRASEGYSHATVVVPKVLMHDGPEIESWLKTDGFRAINFSYEDGDEKTKPFAPKTENRIVKFYW